MAHLSENSLRLNPQITSVISLGNLEQEQGGEAAVYLYRLPWGRTHQDAQKSAEAFRQFADLLGLLPEEATVCVLTTPPDAAALLPYLENVLKFQLWVAAKTTPDAYPAVPGQMPQRHAALLVLTRYRGALKHTKTRIGYSYCPACGKTTKDYGGKKHTYHEYGTLASDIWRDIEIAPSEDIHSLTERLCDLFGIDSYQHLQIVDLRDCLELRPYFRQAVREVSLPLEWETPSFSAESQLLNMDSLEALKTIPSDSIDFCFTDPPYNIQKAYDKWSDALEMVEYFRWCDEWLLELYRVLKPGRTLAVLNIPQWAVRHFQHIGNFMQFQNWIAWDGLSFPVRLIMPAHYAVLCLSKGPSRPLPGLRQDKHLPLDTESLSPLKDGYCLRASCVQQRRRQGQTDRGMVTDLWADVHRLKHNSRRVDHPCQLPPLLMQRLYALFTEPGETILDCFNGAGTSTLVAQQMGRNFVGIELSQYYHEIALGRHKQIGRGEDPFGKNADTGPKAKNSRVQRMTKQHYEVSKKQLQLDVRRIAQALGRLPTRDDVETLSPFPIRYFDDYFASWGEVCAAARTTGMSELPAQSLKAELEPQLTLL